MSLLFIISSHSLKSSACHDLSLSIASVTKPIRRPDHFVKALNGTFVSSADFFGDAFNKALLCITFQTHPSSQKPSHTRPLSYLHCCSLRSNGTLP
jgi:hypothetical protein